jgi:hypothetical protein
MRMRPYQPEVEALRAGMHREQLFHITSEQNGKVPYTSALFDTGVAAAW